VSSEQVIAEMRESAAQRPDTPRAFKTPRAAFNQYRSAEFEAADAEGSWTFRPEPFDAFLAGWKARKAAQELIND
jgi:hypothetical protein